MVPPIDPSKITVVHCDPFTGHIIDPVDLEEEQLPAPAQQPCPTFATAEEAKDYCRDVVRRYPHLECHVTGPGLPPWRFRDESWIKRKSEARKASIEASLRRARQFKFAITSVVVVGFLAAAAGLLLAAKSGLVLATVVGAGGPVVLLLYLLWKK
jgi:hypothetical protein